MAEQPLATEASSSEQTNELQKVTALLAATNLKSDYAAKEAKDGFLAGNTVLKELLGVTEKTEDSTSDTSENTKGIKTSAVTFTKILGDMKSIAQTTLDDARQAAKRALRLASKVDPSKYLKAMADKTKSFAGDLLGLLMKGGVLVGLALLLEWLASQDWEAWWNEWGPKIKTKWEELKTTFTNFYNDNVAIFDSLAALGALALEWKALAWLGKTTSPIVKLMAALGKIFAVSTGSIALLLVEVTAWLGKGLFNIATGTLGLLWAGIKKIFGLTGTIATLVKEVTAWAGKGLFNITTGVLSLLWGEIKKIFGLGGKIATFVTTVTEWTKTTMFGSTGHLANAWAEIKKIFGAGGKISTFFTTVADYAKTSWFDEAGEFRQAWAKIKGIFAIDGKLGAFRKWIDGLGDVMMFDEAGDMRKSWKWIKGIFGQGGKIGEMIKALGEVPTWFDEGGEFRKIWKFIKGIFGPEGKIKKAWDVVSGAADWWNDRADLLGMWTHLKGIFGAEGKIANALKSFKKLGFGWFDEGGSIRKIFTWFGSLFGKESALGKFIGTLQGWVTKFGEWFGTAAKKTSGGINSFFDFFGDIIGKIKSFVKAVTDNPIVKGIKKFFSVAIKAGAGAASWIGKFFAPIGWIMAIFEAVSGFWDGFKEQGADDTRTFGEKIMDGLKGALTALVDFFVIDMAMMIQDILNWVVGKINKLGSWIPGFDGFKEFTFAEDLQRASHNLIDKMIPQDALGVDQEEKLKKQAGVASRKNLAGLGLGELDKEGDEFMMDSGKLASMIKGMGVMELAKMQAKLALVEERRGISAKGGGPEWEAVMKKRLDELDKKSSQAVGQMSNAIIDNKSFFGGGGNSLGLKIPSKDESTATKAVKDG